MKRKTPTLEREEYTSKKLSLADEKYIEMPEDLHVVRETSGTDNFDELDEALSGESSPSFTRQYHS